jgi:hypothetical protein
MLPLEKTGLLQAFLGSLPQEIAMRLARAVELDRLMDGKGLPHDAILTGLRPILRQSGQQARTPTPLRLFCRPFEDLLSSANRRGKQKASIARASVAPVWQWLSRTLAPDQAQAFVAETRALILAQKQDEAVARATQFWTLAGNRIREALAGDAGRKAARAALSSDIAVADAEEIALLLLAGLDVLKIQSVLPKPVTHLNEDLVWQLRAIYDELIIRNPDAAPYVAVIAMNRLTRPWEALKLPMQICRQTQDTLISQTDMGLVGEILLGRMDDLKAAILAVRHPIADVAAVLVQVASFAEMSSAIVKEIEVRRDGEWGQRLLKDRAAVGNVMDGLLDRAPRELTQALPLQKSSGPKLADFSRPLDPEKRAVALKYVKLATGCRNFAAAASCAAKQKTSTEDMGNYLRRHNEDLVKELRGADPARRAAAESQFEFCVEITALLFSEEEAELLRRRGRAAQSAAA